MIVRDYGQIDFRRSGQRKINDLHGRQFVVFFDFLLFSIDIEEVDIMLVIITAVKLTKELEKGVSFEIPRGGGAIANWVPSGLLMIEGLPLLITL